MMDKTWIFEPMDTLFFRDGKPIDPGETGQLVSMFPPTPATMQGMVRTRILTEFSDNYQVENGNWKLKEKHIDSGIDLNEQIGKKGQSKDLGKLKLSGPFFSYKKERLYPLPLDVVEADSKLFFLRPDEKVTRCDLGEIRLPSCEQAGGKVLPECYLTQPDMEKLLTGTLPKLENLFFLFPPEGRDVADNKIIADREYRIGLARDNQTRTHRDGCLYAMSPVRTREAIKLEVDLFGIEGKLQDLSPQLQRMGGEGKLSGITIKPLKEAPVTGSIQNRFKIVFITPARFDQVKDRFKENNSPAWLESLGNIGNLENIDRTLVSACIGKPLKIGGWDLVKRCPKEIVSYMPAGSVLFFESGQEIDRKKLADLQKEGIGEETALGYGQFLIGTW